MAELNRLAATLVGGLLLTAAQPAAAADPVDTLAAVQAAHLLSCGVVAETLDWNKEDLHGSLEPLDAAICAAVGVAALGQDGRVEIKRYPVELDAETALHDGAVDLVVGVTPTITAGLGLGLGFGPAVFFDAQGFLVRRDAGATTLEGLAGRRVCYIDGTDTERTLQSHTLGRGIAILPSQFQEQGEMDDALLTGRCQAVSANLSKLAETRASFHDPDDFVFLADTLTVQPAAPAYRRSDARWAALVDTTLQALVTAEALGLTQGSSMTSEQDDPALQRLIGEDWATASALGLPKDWALKMVETIGNYGEVYERTVGAQSSLRLPRGLNALWRQGGLMVAGPMQ